MIKKIITPQTIQVTLFVAGILLWVYISDSGLMSDTLITLKEIGVILMIITALSTVITLLISKILCLESVFVGHVIYGVVFTNALFWAVFLNINYRFCVGETRERFPILSRGFQGSPKHANRNKYVMVNIDGKETEVSYKSDVNIDSLQNIELTIAKGVLGYKVIVARNIPKQ